MRSRALLLLILCAVFGQARAGLFSDEEARKQIGQLEARVSKLEEADAQRTQVMLDLQSQIQAQDAEIRTLQGQNEELQHDVQDAEKRQKDFYVDLDGRVRHLETSGAQPVQSGAAVPIDPVAENRDYDAAYGLFKANKQQDSIKAFQDFLQRYPGSTLAPNAYFWMGVAYYALKDYKNAENSYLTAASKYPTSDKAPNALMGAAICYQDNKEWAAARKTLQQIIKNYPDSNLVPRAKKRLAALKNKK